MTLQVHLEARKYLPKVHLVLFRIVPIDCIAVRKTVVRLRTQLNQMRF